MVQTSKKALLFPVLRCFSSFSRSPGGLYENLSDASIQSWPKIIRKYRGTLTKHNMRTQAYWSLFELMDWEWCWLFIALAAEHSHEIKKWGASVGDDCQQTKKPRWMGARRDICLPIESFHITRHLDWPHSASDATDASPDGIPISHTWAKKWSGTRDTEQTRPLAAIPDRKWGDWMYSWRNEQLALFRLARYHAVKVRWSRKAHPSKI